MSDENLQRQYQDLPLYRFSTTPAHIHHTIRPVPSGSAAADPATGLSDDLTTVAVKRDLRATDVSRRLVWARQPTEKKAPFLSSATTQGSIA